MKLSATLLALILVTAAPAGCQPPAAEGGATPTGHTSPDEAFASFDVTEDGWLSGTEVTACACGHYDADGDGEVTRGEFLAASAGAGHEAGPEPGLPSPPAGACASVGGARLRLEKTRFAPREPMRVEFARAQPGYMDNVEFHRVDRAGSEKAGGAFVWGEAEGARDLAAPGAPGAYEARYVADGSGETLACVPFRVEAVPADAPSAVGTVAEGVYETYFHGYDGMMNKWLAGDIEVLPGGRYAFQGETGRYGHDPASGRVVWTGGGLDGVYAVLRESDGRPALLIPLEENRRAGRELAVSDVWGYLRR